MAASPPPDSGDDSPQLSDEDGGEGAQATPVVASRRTTSGPAAKKPRLRWSARKRPAKPPQLKVGDRLQGKFGPLVGRVADGRRRKKSQLHGVIVAEACVKKNIGKFGGTVLRQPLPTRVNRRPPLQGFQTGARLRFVVGQRG